mmetsp:Transcript_29351/g.52549  ORF Transcript_29351/g.52549 Transcript_29351/m.52549 type:complete len:219 (+) Transcript_29351:486-1142(+)
MQESAAKAKADLDQLLQSMQASRERFAQTQEEERKAKLLQQRNELFQKKQREGKFSLDPSKRPKWKTSDRHTPQELVFNKTFLPPGDLTATEIYRTAHLIPRTYAKSQTPFLLTRNTNDYFPRPDESLLSKHGRQTLSTRKLSHNEEVDRRMHEEMKLKVVHFGPRWEPNKSKGGFFSVEPSNPVNYYARDLPPKYMQEQPFLRTNRAGGYFGKPDSV